MLHNKLPMKQGLYDPSFEHDACGIGFIANLKEGASHLPVKQGISMLCRLEHRGAQAGDSGSGDGAGILTQIPHSFFQNDCSQFSIKEPGSYGVGMVFLPHDEEIRARCEEVLNRVIEEEGQELLGWRTVPVNDSCLGKAAKTSQPFIRQVFIGRGKEHRDEELFERKLYIIRKRSKKEIHDRGVAKDGTFYVASLSARTIVYKGMLTPDQLEKYYLDLQNEAYQSSFSLVHSRYSTNTFPSWERAHPNRMLIHNGEINTVNGNINWIRARENRMESSLFGEKLKDIMPIIDEDGSDSSSFDNCLEFLTRSGRSLPHAAMMMVPEPWEKNDSMDDSLKAFYEFHSHLMEPWDGPAAFAFTDGLQIGAMQDRNGLRPARYYVTVDGTIIFASEVGVIDIEPDQILEKGRLSPGKMLLVDLKEGRIIPDEEVKTTISQAYPYRQWLDEKCTQIHQLEAPIGEQKNKDFPLFRYQQAFGYTVEELKKVLGVIGDEGKEPINSMGHDSPLAVLSNRSQLLYNYFKQLFAQVTNPPIDAIREKYVTSSLTFLGAEGNLLNVKEDSCRRIKLETPIIVNQELAKIRGNNDSAFKTMTFPITFAAEGGEDALEKALDQLFGKVDEAIEQGVSLIILSDQGLSRHVAAIPALLAVSGLHHHLVRQGTRTKVSLIVETGEARDVHQLSMLVGYGADAINPYLAQVTLQEMAEKGELGEGMDAFQAVQNYVKAMTSGMIKILSKMGISTIQSYRGAQIFEAIGIDQTVINRYFTGTTSAIGGIKLHTIAEETLMRHRLAFAEQEVPLEAGSEFQYRKNGEIHALNPEIIRMLKVACQTNDYDLYKKYAEKANEDQLIFIRDLFTFENSPSNPSIPIEEVESVESIVRRFKTGAMSYGSLSQEAHETLAIAMNRLGGKSNSGEGGEHPDRYLSDANGDSRCSKIKQVASGRFGVTSHYLVNAEEIQIKIAQGAKPGEGGQLPGHKVYPWIAEVRGSTPGVGLISPPPHHDIYSIEDLAQLIHDLKNANPKARISVKLVAKAGVGTIAAGVAKGLADVILISGYDGGTGAAPRSSIKHAGIPWEIGLSETHQTLVLNGLRDRVVLEADGKMMTGRDIVMATLLGAEEYGFATTALVVLGCVLVRQCHLNTCPVGIATQDPELRKKFLGKPEHVEAFMRFIAQDVREIMAQLGFRTVIEMVGRTDLLIQSDKAKSHWKAKDLDLSKVLYQPSASPKTGLYHQKKQEHGLENSLDYKSILEVCRPALERQQKVRASFPIENINRTVGTLLGSEISRKYGAKGLVEDTIQLQFTGSAGQSFGSFLPKGVTVTLEGDANDYIGKGLSGGKIIVTPSTKSIFKPEENTIIGNVAFYGATSGEAYIRGLAGERFGVRNSGVQAVVEGIGDHGCEYMTGGCVVVLGPVGKNFAAGMSGGIAYVFAEDLEEFRQQCNLGLIDLDPLEEDEDKAKLRKLIQNHYDYTGSTRAASMLHHWKENLSKWVKVIPKEYKRILQLNLVDTLTK
ncbi:glutamate synthase large subunit [Ammoniphilus resinae]|uniref:Glutamate synthase domain-containing protein 2/glutamate synthase domain-containing protein 1/glutamate synthase domain-containing protein 3 n=1 Tax=Ammoniphilus resinae TaxID=861532 RepID=A0ABS4GRN1_9BACL|nr:glutamate synthase large subunit [Ammoniphilus resinae]MBP1932787.1 glutamate synthase domain-containing protein 2/glutamate synthase domain-containing protein 1/glutamate synthase domain-containing protein 3 [Ammoniphilus resinae]